MHSNNCPTNSRIVPRRAGIPHHCLFKHRSMTCRRPSSSFSTADAFLAGATSILIQSVKNTALLPSATNVESLTSATTMTKSVEELTGQLALILDGVNAYTLYRALVQLHKMPNLTGLHEKQRAALRELNDQIEAARVELAREAYKLGQAYGNRMQVKSPTTTSTVGLPWLRDT